VLDDDEAVFGVLEGGDEEAADETEDEDVALHDGVEKKYNGNAKEVVSPGEKTGGPRRDALAFSRSAARLTISVQTGLWEVKDEVLASCRLSGPSHMGTPRATAE
jgi:hypothetical protein